MPLNPRNHSVAELVAKLDDLSVSQIEALEESELAGRARKSLLAAIKEALDAHAGLEEKLDEIADSAPEEEEEDEVIAGPVDVLAGITVAHDRLGWFAFGGPADAYPGFDSLRFGSEDACRTALANRVLS